MTIPIGGSSISGVESQITLSLSGIGAVASKTTIRKQRFNIASERWIIGRGNLADGNEECKKTDQTRSPKILFQHMRRLLPLPTIMSTGVNHGKILGSHPRRRPNRGFAPIKTRTERGRSAGQSAITPSEVKFAPNFEREL